MKIAAQFIQNSDRIAITYDQEAQALLKDLAHLVCEVVASDTFNLTTADLGTSAQQRLLSGAKLIEEMATVRRKRRLLPEEMIGALMAACYSCVFSCLPLEVRARLMEGITLIAKVTPLPFPWRLYLPPVQEAFEPGVLAPECEAIYEQLRTWHGIEDPIFFALPGYCLARGLAEIPNPRPEIQVLVRSLESITGIYRQARTALERRGANNQRRGRR